MTEVGHSDRGTRHWSAWVREDVGAVAPLGSYAAKRCPVRTQLDVLRPVEPAPVSDFLAMLGRRGDEFEDDIVDDLAELGPLHAVTATTREELVTATLAAMRDGAPMVVGGRLPVDLEGRRVGEPDLLVRVGDIPQAGAWRYAPVDMKSHRSLTNPGSGTTVVVQELDDLAVPQSRDATVDAGRPGRSARDDTLQLAHYHRLLAACGHATTGAPWGGIVGSEGQVVWYRLDIPRWSTPTADPDRDRKERSALEVYDFEFGFRLDIAAVARQHLDDPTVDLLVEPVKCSECSECPWREHCLPQLAARRDVSLLPRVGFTVWRALRDAGLGTIDALAAAPSTIEVDGISDATLAELRLQARAWCAPEPVVPRGTPTPAPRADVEVDVDMENDLDGAYLWGAWVTDRSGRDVHEDGYRAFADWDEDFDDAARADVFERFWSWLQSLRAACEAEGLTFAAYCWYEAAENRYLREGAALTGREDEVEQFIASPEWIDLHRWFRDNYATGRGNGLKTVAGLLGFSWRDDDPGGASSMLWRQQAIDPETAPDQRLAARDRLLAYNEDDVRATLAVREALPPEDERRSD